MNTPQNRSLSHIIQNPQFLEGFSGLNEKQLRDLADDLNAVAKIARERADKLKKMRENLTDPDPDWMPRIHRRGLN